MHFTSWLMSPRAISESLSKYAFLAVLYLLLIINALIKNVFLPRWEHPDCPMLKSCSWRPSWRCSFYTPSICFFTLLSPSSLYCDSPKFSPQNTWSQHHSRHGLNYDLHAWSKSNLDPVPYWVCFFPGWEGIWPSEEGDCHTPRALLGDNYPHHRGT